MHESILYRFPFSCTVIDSSVFAAINHQRFTLQFLCKTCNHNFGTTRQIFIRKIARRWKSKKHEQRRDSFAKLKQKLQKQENNHECFTKGHEYQDREEWRIPSALISLTNCNDKKTDRLKEELCFTQKIVFTHVLVSKVKSLVCCLCIHQYKWEFLANN